MIAFRFLFMAEYVSRLEGNLRWLQWKTASSLRPRLLALGRWWRPYPPLPYLNDHLYRDIGLEPPQKREEGIWPW